MVSNSTAVPHIQSEPGLKNITNIKQHIKLLEDKSEFNIEKLNYFAYNSLTNGIFDFIISLINAIISFIINKIIDFINSLTLFIENLMQLVSKLIDAINALIDAINQFIDLIIGFFTPENTEINQ
jgi:hypothetical protein